MKKACQEMIGSQCAPVLMNVKPSNLLIMTAEEERYFLKMEMVEGISGLCLYRGSKKSTWLLYRRDALESVLVWPMIREFLHTYGYCPEQEKLDDMLGQMAGRFARYREGHGEFPHELGIFLGYPLGDVKGFIEHKGKEYLCSGYWKVYQDVSRAQKTFQLYRTVRDRVMELLKAGLDLQEISCLAY